MQSHGPHDGAVERRVEAAVVGLAGFISTSQAGGN